MKNLLLALLVVAPFILGCGLNRQAANQNGEAPAGGAGATVSGGAPTNAVRRTFASDTDLAREALTLLVNGDPSAEDLLDWENFRVGPNQVGPQYGSIPNDAGKDAFRKAFISSFSQSFKATGASLDKVTKWQQTSKEGDDTKVTASLGRGKGIVLTVSHRDGQPRLAAIDAK